MTAPPPARTLDFGASAATASLLVKMTITFGVSERRDQMITFSLFEKLMKEEMPQNQGELDATLLVDDKKEHLINNLASSWIYEKLVTNVRLSDKKSLTRRSILTPVLNLITTSTLGHNPCYRIDTHRITSSQSATGALFRSLIVV